ncbi:hypothetical protein, partial [Pseudomonas aeruginosa]|uniref:hypothetical protein n=1 Tax=Pseudomonas aeruginosa TaxID=287 RepID=UPI0021BD4A7C
CNPCVAALRLPGRMAVEQVARWPWNAWPDESGLGGRMAWNPQFAVSVSVSSDIGVDFRAPPFSVALRPSSMRWAAMPETSIHENCSP